MNTRVADVLDRARELLNGGENWCKGRNYNHGKYCLRGAIAKAATGDPNGKSPFVLDVYVWVAKFLPRDTRDWGLAYFNDFESTWADVDALLAKAAKEARAT